MFILLVQPLEYNPIFKLSRSEYHFNLNIGHTQNNNAMTLNCKSSVKIFLFFRLNCVEKLNCNYPIMND